MSTSPIEGQTQIAPKAPPRWKFAIVVWLAIYHSLTFLLWLAGPTLAHWPLEIRTLAATAVLVPWMVFFMIPFIQRLLAPWLRPGRNRRVAGGPET